MNNQKGLSMFVYVVLVASILVFVFAVAGLS
jgi:hypothetical protein